VNSSGHPTDPLVESVEQRSDTKHGAWTKEAFEAHVRTFPLDAG